MIPQLVDMIFQVEVFHAVVLEYVVEEHVVEEKVVEHRVLNYEGVAVHMVQGHVAEQVIGFWNKMKNLIVEFSHSTELLVSVNDWEMMLVH